MSARGLRQILNSPNREIDAATFARIVLGSEDRVAALLGSSGATLCGSSTKAQEFVRAATAVLLEAVKLNPDEAQILRWFNAERLSLFDNRTPAEVTASGLVAPLVDYVKSLDAGWTG